ncbi:MAG TPA: alcohol dehydrogenase catalytic domain-containing protein [Spirochaetia bacterium]|nr:alcohol dehydrogenase catalytic domain-containing protein [Spirochaetia bacterium]
MKVRSLWYAGVRKTEIREIELPAPGPRDVLVRIEACGVCTWDLFIFSGGFQGQKKFPFYFGHEGIGRVESVGSGVTRLRSGDRVALRETPDIGSVGGGHMAEYAIQDESVLVPLPNDDVPAEQWMIEPLACCVNAVNLVRIQPGMRVALVGSGFMGSILLQLLALSPVAEVAAFDMRKESLEYARSLKSRGPVTVFDLNDKSAVSASMDGTFDLVFEAAAVEPALRLANRLVRKGGTLAIFSWHHHDILFDFGDWHSRGITVLNTSPAANPHFADCFSQSVPLISTGRIDLAPLITHVAPPEEAQPLYEKGLAKTDGYIKGVIRWK